MVCSPRIAIISSLFNTLATDAVKLLDFLGGKKAHDILCSGCVTALLPVPACGYKGSHVTYLPSYIDLVLRNLHRLRVIAWIIKSEW